MNIIIPLIIIFIGIILIGTGHQIEIDNPEKYEDDYIDKISGIKLSGILILFVGFLLTITYIANI